MKRRKAIIQAAGIIGSAALTPTLLSILQSCQASTDINWKPIALNQNQALLISQLADTILPKTETPGALDLKVDRFIDRVIGEVYSTEGKAALLDNLDAWNASCENSMGAPFAALTTDKRATFLMEEERKAPKFNGSVWGTKVGKQEPVGFYRSMKSMILWGYFSSAYVGKNILSYDPIPGVYQGCIPLDDVGSSWSL